MVAHDVIIVGAGPAGSTAAGVLAGRGRRVALLDAETPPRPVACAGWLNSAIGTLLAELDLTLDDVGAVPIDTVTFHTADLAKQATPSFKAPPGYFVDRGRFDAALAHAAERRGATLLGGHRVTDVVPREQSIDVVDEHGTCSGRLLLVASGRDTASLSRLGLARKAEPALLWCAVVEHKGDAVSEPRKTTPSANKTRSATASTKGARAASRTVVRPERVRAGDRPARPKAEGTPSVDRSRLGTAEPLQRAADMHVVLGLDRAGTFATLIRGPGRWVLAVHARASREQATAELLSLADRLAGHGLLPSEHAAIRPGDVKLARSPAGVALDVESHVGKHALVIGDAGGFVSSVSNEGIYPAMWSAKIAAEVVSEAIDSTNSQDTLMTFETRWRSEMGEYLRMPNTDVQFLLPLIFSNQPMANRMAAAFFFGENI